MKIIAAIAAKLPFTSRKTAAAMADRAAAAASAQYQHKAALVKLEADYLRGQLAQAHRANVRLKAELADEAVGNR